MKIVYMGTPEFSKVCLEKIIEEKFEVELVITNPDKKTGRGQKVLKSPVKLCAEENNIEIYQPNSLRNVEAIEKLKKINPDIIVVVAYGKILLKEILEIPKYGCINVHGSLLPKYRGAAPIQWAVLNGEKKTGITTMYMAEGMDTGDMIEKREIEISREDTTKTMFDKLAVLGAETLVYTLHKIKEKGEKIKAEKQKDEEATYAPMIEKKMGIINFEDSFEEIYNKIRGLNDFLVARIIISGKMYKIWKAEDKKYSKEEIIVDDNNERIERIDSNNNTLEIIVVKDKKNKKMFFKCKDRIYKNIRDTTRIKK